MIAFLRLDGFTRPGRAFQRVVIEAAIEIPSPLRIFNHLK